MSYGSGGYGSTPWGGGGSPPLSTTAFNIFCFQHCDSMDNILSDPSVSVVDGGSQFFSDPVSCDLEIRSSSAFSTDDARLFVEASVPSSWTLEFTVLLEDLPNDFSDLSSKHLFVACTSAAGVCAGLFISRSGLAYAGSVHHDGLGNMVLDSAIQFLPDSSSLIEEEEYVIFRIAADLTTEAVYVYVTNSSELGITGHKLRYILPAIKAADLAFPSTDQVMVSVRGSVTDGTVVSFDSLCLGLGLIIPNLVPIADAGEDQAVRTCNVVLLDGTQSFDPEGAPLLYQWRLIDAPQTSAFAFEGLDGITLPLVPPTGFTGKFHSASVGSLPVDQHPQVGDVLLIDKSVYEIISSGTDVNGFFIQVSGESIPDGYSGKSFKILYQSSITNGTSSQATFFPDVPGVFKFDLVVNDGSLTSEPDFITVNVLESPIPRGCIPNLGFVWNNLSDFWSLVEDRERIETFFQALVQVAASELLTLWQVDYSKSLRDVQRTIQRRWLHYDLLLAEPLSELTQFRSVKGGVTSEAIDPVVGFSGISGKVLVIESPIFNEPLEYTFFGSDPLSTDQIEQQLTSFLSRDSRFSVTRFSNRSPPASFDADFVRINSSVPFFIGDGTTASLFAVGSKNLYPSGSVGFSLGVRTYKVDRSLLGVGIKNGDLLHIGNESFVIDRVIDVEDDEFPFQRVVVETDLPLVPGSTWSISGWCTSRLIDFYNGLVSSGDSVTLEVTNSSTKSFELVEVEALGVSELDPGKLGVNLEAVDEFLSQPEFTVRLAKVNRRRYVPIDSLIVDVPCLQESIESPEQEVLRRNVDFFLEEFRGRKSIRFVVSNSNGPDVWEGNKPPDRVWAETTYVDNRPAIESNFGIPAEFTLDDLGQVSNSMDYLSAVRGLWYAYIKGPKIKNLRVGAQILLGLPFAEEPGIIEEIRTDFSPKRGRLLIRDQERTEIVRSYTFPKSLELEINPDTGEAYKVGDAVRQFEPLVSGAEVIDWIKDPKWFQGLLNQGSFFEVEKFHRFLVRVDSAAFSLDTLQFVRRFILRIKPNHTHPLFDVLFKVEDTEGSEVNVTDQIAFHGTLHLNDSICAGFGVSTMFDETNPSGGGYESQFDTDPDPGTPSPVFPTPDPDGDVKWGFDKNYLCPNDFVDSYIYIDMDGSTAIDSDTTFAFGSSMDSIMIFSIDSPGTVPAAPAGLTLPAITNDVVPFTGTLLALRLVASGIAGLDPKDYEIVISVNGIDQFTLPITISDFGYEVVSPVFLAVTAGDVIGGRLRPASGVGARTVNWTSLRLQIGQFNVLSWDNATTPPAGRYGQSRAQF